MAEAAAETRFSRARGVRLTARVEGEGSRSVVLLPGIGLALEYSVPGPLECMTAVTVGPRQLVGFEAGR